MIYQFADYRDFLKHRFLMLKIAEGKVSIAVLAREIGCSTSFVKKLFARKVHLGFKYLEPLSEFLRLNPAEEKYLILTVVYYASPGRKVRTLLDGLLGELRAPDLPTFQNSNS